jgi:enoyl-CoA hydratase/carnithine racemase
MNAMALTMWESLPELLARAEQDPNIVGISLEGEGERAFCAGADISQFGDNRSGADAVAHYDKAVEAGNRALAEVPKPTVAVIRGICFGGGFGLAMCCDLRIARDDARFRIPAARLGLGYGFKGTELLVRKLGMGPVADLLLSARIIGADEAKSMGLVNAVFSHDTFAREAAAYLARIAANAPITLQATKRALIELTRDEAARDISAVDALVSQAFASADYLEGQAAFRDKRDPVFKGT